MRNEQLFTSKSDEHYTPRKVIDRALDMWGEIDLDPCSNSRMFPNVPSKKQYTAYQNGLLLPWGGCVFVNPPYSDMAAWTEKAIREYGRGVEILYLTAARTDTKWFQLLEDYPVCFIELILKDFFNFPGMGNIIF